ncbi:hypothetical protein [Actinomadura verrucosospora]|uniref:Uncharacterized protein n=1 Tax=Actinomadura verrucosospora TaxID=46165 RepID=A0A7D3VQ22_ACTVE|nr:hypothetical protein [Actinomadura verrucosospora]QKG20020.1 hypothetical protein ACTIVE_1656 [Actinomadura verrucosospora]
MPGVTARITTWGGRPPDDTAADEPFALEKWPTAPLKSPAGDIDGEMIRPTHPLP